jgi:hypothetical protein
MTHDLQTLAIVAMAVALAGMVWALFWPVTARARRGDVSAHWDLAYLDDDGVLRFTIVRVIAFNLSTRRMTAWCTSSASERVFKLSRIVKATDVRSGSRIDLARLMDRTGLLGRMAQAHNLDAQPANSDNSERAGPAGQEPGALWSASRLGLY